MTVGVASAEIAAVLNLYRGTNATGGSTYLQLHTGDPGASGTANLSAVTSRQQVTFNAPSGGQITLSSMGGGFSMTATETITHVSLWDASTSGNFRRSIVLSANKPVVSGDTLNMTTVTVGYQPVAA